MPIDPKIIDQFNLIVEALPDTRAFPATWLEDDEDFRYLYREGSLLMRDAVADEVVGLVGELLQLRALEPNAPRDATLIRRMRAGGGVEPGRFLAEAPMPGLTRLWFGVPLDDQLPVPRNVPDLLEMLDGRFGLGAVRPEAVLHVCGHCCPAKEPEELLPGAAVPFPPLQPAGQCDGAGVSVTLVDTGWLAEPVDPAWLNGVTGDPELYTFDAAGRIQKYGMHGRFAAGCIRVTAPAADVYVDGSLTANGARNEVELALQIRQALERDPDVLVFCFATNTRAELSTLGLDLLFENDIENRAGLAVLAPACNDGRNEMTWPAAYERVVSVGALTRDGTARANFSNFGDWVKVFAPGQDLVNAYATGILVCHEGPDAGTERAFTGAASWSGTSFSTPLVAGMVAARMSANQNLTARQAADELLLLAESQRLPDVGPVLLPDQACAPIPD